jgi:autotransporter-associated beta strand protein
VNNSGSLIFNRVEDLTYAGSISGPGTVEKHKGGRLILTGTHTYSGSTKVVAGTLLVDGTLGSSAVSVAGGALGGRGVINGPVTIQAGGRLDPGSSTGPLAINNSLTLSGTTAIKLDAATGAGGLVRGLSNVTFGGTLSLTNIPAPLAASHAFKLFDATNYAGTFTTLTPVTPGPGLAWNTSTLGTDGTLRVVSLTAPVLSIERDSSCPPPAQCLTLSWPAEHLGWRLQRQTDSLSANWQDVPNSKVTNQMVLPG